MIEKISCAIVKKFEAFDIVNNENRDIYLFGTYQGLVLIINLISMILIGIAFGQIFECLLYMLLFIPMRSFAGGYHASSPQRCYVYSMACIVLAMLIIKFTVFNLVIYYIASIISGAVIFNLAPVEDQNKPLDKVEIIHYRVRTQVTLVIEGLFFVVSMTLNWNTGMICTTLSLVTLCLMLIAGKIKNKLIRRQ